MAPKVNIVRLPTIPYVNPSWSISEIAEHTAPNSWANVFSKAKNELKTISDILDEQERLHGPYMPLKQDIFRAFHLCPLNKVKVVIVGQDPYHQYITIDNETVPRATGLSFSVRPDDNIPVSLKNIYKEILSTVAGFKMPNHGDLTNWALQGILMLNTCLTVRANTPGSHDELWLGFIDRVIRAIAEVNPQCVFVLWGREAQKLKSMLRVGKFVILEAAHPSGFSAHRGFFGCNHFTEINRILSSQNKTGIKWSLNEPLTIRYRSKDNIPIEELLYS